MKKYKDNLKYQFIDGQSFISSYNIIVAKIDVKNEQIIQYENFPEKIQKHIDYVANVYGWPLVKKFSK